ncbi:MAG: ribosome-associated translation inhibitor RaiA [Cyanobacteria bacterium NC_groundwater_1444_Ag_S-0.65um_54_12]|nr:ribosome-associated translation inhibitor RaiA [Cyanobacteria bacterium NC_groundwater_1444_Ag_S-0.65um_54_12]
MELVIKGKNLDVTDSLREYATRKLGRLTRSIDGIMSAQVELSVIKNPSVADNQIVEVTLMAGGTVIRGEDASNSMYASIDQVSDKIERQLRRLKQRMEDRRHHRTKTSVAVVSEEEAAEVFPETESPQIIKLPSCELKPMAPEDAAYQLDLSGKDFLVFINRHTEAVAVIYHRRDGNYGLIEPTSA